MYVCLSVGGRQSVAKLSYQCRTMSARPSVLIVDKCQWLMVYGLLRDTSNDIWCKIIANCSLWCMEGRVWWLTRPDIASFSLLAKPHFSGRVRACSQWRHRNFHLGATGPQWSPGAKYTGGIFICLHTGLRDEIYQRLELFVYIVTNFNCRKDQNFNISAQMSHENCFLNVC